MKGIYSYIRVLTAAIMLVLLASAPGLSQVIDASDPLDLATTYSARYFECNGSYQERYAVWWLSTANPLKMRRSYSAIWFFEGADVKALQADDFVLRLDLLVYTNSKESGGKPTAAAVDIIVTNPNTLEVYQAPNVRVEMNPSEMSIPTYVYVPKRMLTEDGRTKVELKGAGQIGVGQTMLRLLIPQERY